MSDTWTPEQMCQRATALVESGCYCGEAQCYACITANMLRQGAADRERVTALEANLATVDTLRQAAEASKVELAGQVKGLEAEVARLEEESFCPPFVSLE